MSIQFDGQSDCKVYTTSGAKQCTISSIRLVGNDPLEIENAVTEALAEAKYALVEKVKECKTRSDGFECTEGARILGINY